MSVICGFFARAAQAICDLNATAHCRYIVSQCEIGSFTYYSTVAWSVCVSVSALMARWRLSCARSGFAVRTKSEIL
jgi:hypothetical protein